MIKKLIAALVVVVLIVVGFGVWYFVIRDDSVEKSTVGCDPEPCEASTADSTDGTWTIDPAASEAKLVITETIGGLADHQVQGNTGEVTGDVTVAGSEVTAADLTVDLTGLEFTDAPPGFNVANRANAMKTTGLETEAFPEATFVLTAPIALSDDVTSGEVITSEATGDLTLHGVTNPVTFEISVVAKGDTFEVTPSEFIPVVLSDHDMSVDAPGFVADIADEGSFDFVLVLEQA